MSRRRFTKEFKTAVAQWLLRGESGSALARELEVKRAKLYEWASQLERYGDDAFPGPGRRGRVISRGFKQAGKAKPARRRSNARLASGRLRSIFFQQALRR